MCGLVSPAIADGTLTGRVLDPSEQPVKDATVVISSGDGASEATVTTDPTGRYTATVRPGPHAVTIAFGSSRVTRSVDIPAAGETKLDAALDLLADSGPRPIRFAKPKQDPLAIPAYSDAATRDDVWARAWLVLDIDRHGTVARVKFLVRPGHDLDAVALRHAFNLRFAPARDDRDDPVSSSIVWSLEWPAASWLRDHHVPATQLPRGIEYPGCGRRDCTVPDLANATATAGWVARDLSMGAAPVFVEDPRQVLREEVTSARRHRIGAYVTTGLTVVLLGASVVTWVEEHKWSGRVDGDNQPSSTIVPPEKVAADKAHLENWKLAGVGLSAGALLAGVAAGYLWSHATLDFAVGGNGERATLGISGRF
jgi:hypothetical protein